MERKGENIFDKLNRQEEQINDLKSKITVDNEKLYALALRCFRLGDYKNAMHHFNHYSLLNPDDLKAPFYAYLCTVSGRHHYSEYIAMVEEVNEVFINYLDEVYSKNPEELMFFVRVIEEYYNKIVKSYLKNKKQYNKINANYIWYLQKVIRNTISKVESLGESASSLGGALTKLEDLTEKTNEVPLIEQQTKNEIVLAKQKQNYLKTKASPKVVSAIKFSSLFSIFIFATSIASTFTKYSILCSIVYILIAIYAFILMLVFLIDLIKEKYIDKGQQNIIIDAIGTGVFTEIFKFKKDFSELFLILDYLFILLAIIMSIVNFIVVLVTKIDLFDIFDCTVILLCLVASLNLHKESLKAILEKEK